MQTNPNPNPNLNPNPVALVTGGAKRVGAEIVRTLHRNGFDVVIHFNSSETDARALQIELSAARANSVLTLQADITRQAELPALVQKTIARFGRLDALINNASSFYPTPLDSMSEAQAADLFATNAFAPLFLSQAAAPHLAQHKGAIVNMVDIYAERPLPRYTPYCMAKAALVAMTYALARELGPDVRVNGVAPGNIMWSSNMEKAETPAIVTERTALKRQGSPRDIAETIAFLLKPDSYITGQILRVDGGRWLFI
jgi:pteridine reductase